MPCSQCFELTKDVCFCSEFFCQLLEFINDLISKKDRIPKNKTDVGDWLIEQLYNVSYQTTDNGHARNGQHGFWCGECVGS